MEYGAGLLGAVFMVLAERRLPVTTRHTGRTLVKAALWTAVRRRRVLIVALLRRAIVDVQVAPSCRERRRRIVLCTPILPTAPVRPTQPMQPTQPEQLTQPMQATQPAQPTLPRPARIPPSRRRRR